MTRRALGCNLGRDLERNYSPARSIMVQFRVNVVGSLGKIRVNTEGGDEAADWFNGTWAKDCDFRSDMHWSDWLQNTLAGIIREGDQLSVFDDGLTPDDTGKLLSWEADQIVPIADGKLPAEWKGCTQDNGILRDQYGREVAYIATGKRGVTQLSDAKDATIYKRGVAKLMCNPWRHNQGRGVPALITPAGNFCDLYEILGSELQTAKRAAKQYANVSRKDAVADYDNPTGSAAFLPENSGKDSLVTASEGANTATATGAKNYERLEAFAGGYVDYLADGDTVTIPDLKHPNGNLPAFMDAVHGFSGAALGMASAYTRMRADSSYTAFRGDMIMTWVTYYWLQKRMERIAADWAGVRALRWAIRKKIVKPLPAGWEQDISWTWPRMPEVDQLDAENATAQALKNGTLDFSQLLGPDWKRRLSDYAAQVEEIRKLGLPLGILEAKSGGAAPGDNPKKDASAADAAAAQKVKEATK
jgi:capsid protein